MTTSGNDVTLIATIVPISFVCLGLVLLFGAAIVTIKINKRACRSEKSEKQSVLYEEIYQYISPRNSMFYESIYDSNPPASHGYDDINFSNGATEISNYENLTGSPTSNQHHYDRENIRIFDISHHIYDVISDYSYIDAVQESPFSALPLHEGAHIYEYVSSVNVPQILPNAIPKLCPENYENVPQTAESFLDATIDKDNKGVTYEEVPSVQIAEKLSSVEDIYEIAQLYEEVPTIDIYQIVSMVTSIYQKAHFYERVPSVDIALLLSKITENVPHYYERVPNVELLAANQYYYETAQTYEHVPHVDIALLLSGATNTMNKEETKIYEEVQNMEHVTPTVGSSTQNTNILRLDKIESVQQSGLSQSHEMIEENTMSASTCS